MATLRKDGEDLCEVTFFKAKPSRGGIMVIETFGGPVHVRERQGPFLCTFVAECMIPLGEVEIVVGDDTARILVGQVQLIDGVYYGYGVLLN